MRLEIIPFPDPLLRKKSKKVNTIKKDERKLIDDMFDTMYANKGIGLAAPQVGVLKRIIIVDIGTGELVLVNPVLMRKLGGLDQYE
jgi:peptide deformylase